ncbi:MAG: hypothetical protein RIF32_09560 [Leptospirales bacterium]|jgi:hypothetical protein
MFHTSFDSTRRSSEIASHKGTPGMTAGPGAFPWLAFGLVFFSALSALEADVVNEADLGAIAPGESKTAALTLREPQGTLRVRLSGVEGLFYLMVQGRAPAKGGVQPDLGLYFAQRSLDQDLEGDYNREALLLRGGHDYTVRLFQLNQSAVKMRLTISLRSVEAQSLPPGAARAGLLSEEQPSAFYYFDHRQGEALQLNVRSADTNLMLMLSVPDGTMLVRDEVDQSEPAGERIGLKELPAGRYYLEVRRRISGRPAAEDSTFRVAIRAEESGQADAGAQVPTEEENNPTAGGPKPLRSIAHLPVVPGEDFAPGRKIQARLDRDNPRMFHRVLVEEGRPLLIDVQGESGDLMLLVKGPFEYRADFDTGKVPGRELLVLPFAGEYQIIVQPGLENDEGVIPYSVRTSVLNAYKLSKDQPADHSIQITGAGLYHFEAGYNLPVQIRVQGADSADLFLTVYVRKKDGSIEVRNSDTDLNGKTAHESTQIDSSGDVYVVVRQGAGRVSRVSYRIQLSEAPLVSTP